MKVEIHRQLEDAAMLAAEDGETIDDCIAIVREAFERVKECENDPE